MRIVILLVTTAVLAMGGQWARPIFLDSAAHGPCKFAHGQGGHEWVSYINKRANPPTLRLRHLPDSSYYDVDSVGVWSDDISVIMANNQPHVFYVRRNLENQASGTIFHAELTSQGWRIESVDSLHNEYGTLLAAHSSGDTLRVLYHQQWPIGATFVALVQGTKVGNGLWMYDTVISSATDHFEPIATIGSEVMFYHLVRTGDFKSHPTPNDHLFWRQDLCLAKKEGDRWTFETVNNGVDLVSATYDYESEKWFAVFRDEGSWNLSLARGRFGNWCSEILDTGKVTCSPHLDVWQGKPYVLSSEPRERGANAPPWFLGFRGPNWPIGQVELIDSCEQVCSHGMSIRVLPDGRVAVVAALWRRNGRCDEVRYTVREALSINEQEENLALTRAGRAATVMSPRQLNGNEFLFDVTGRLVQPTRTGIYYYPDQKGRVVRILLVR